MAASVLIVTWAWGDADVSLALKRSPQVQKYPPDSESPKLKHELFGKHELFRKRMTESDVHLGQLMALGFREEQLLKAFDSTDGNVEQAIDLLGGSAQRLKASPFLPASTQQAERTAAKTNPSRLQTKTARNTVVQV